MKRWGRGRPTCWSGGSRCSRPRCEAQQAGAGDQQLKEIAAEALGEVYFQDGGRRAGSLEEVHFTDIEHLDFELWSAPRIVRRIESPTLDNPYIGYVEYEYG